MKCECDITYLQYVDVKLPTLYSVDWAMKKKPFVLLVPAQHSIEPLKKETDVTELKGESILN